MIPNPLKQNLWPGEREGIQAIGTLMEISADHG